MMQTRILTLLVLILGVMTNGILAQDVERAYEPLDHLIIRVPDLDRGIRAFADLTGITPSKGGQHPGRGTQNALVSLGHGHYLELLAPITSPPDLPSHLELRITDWAIHTRSLSKLLEELREAGYEMSAPAPGSRRTLEGSVLEWRTSELKTAIDPFPFLIEWSASTTHPSLTAPPGCSLKDLLIESPAAARLRGFLGIVGFKGNVTDKSHVAIKAVLQCPRGLITFE